MSYTGALMTHTHRQMLYTEYIFTTWNPWWDDHPLPYNEFRPVQQQSRAATMVCQIYDAINISAIAQKRALFASFCTKQPMKLDLDLFYLMVNKQMICCFWSPNFIAIFPWDQVARRPSST